MDTHGCSTGVLYTYFGNYHTITANFLSFNHICGAAGRWGGLKQPPAGFRDAPTQEDKAAPLARLQTVVSNTSPGLKVSQSSSLQGDNFLFARFFHTATAALKLYTWTLNILLVQPFWHVKKATVEKHRKYHTQHFSFCLISFLAIASYRPISYQNRSTSPISCTSSFSHLKTNQTGPVYIQSLFCSSGFYWTFHSTT